MLFNYLLLTLRNLKKHRGYAFVNAVGLAIGLGSALFILLYVRDSAKSADFYQDLLGRKPAATFPTFVSFSLDGGFTLGLWSMQTVNPAPSETGSRSELAFMVEDAQLKVLVCGPLYAPFNEPLGNDTVVTTGTALMMISTA